LTRLTVALVNELDRAANGSEKANSNTDLGEESPQHLARVEMLHSDITALSGKRTSQKEE